MNQQIFREKSIERVESPEQLNDYVKVTSPGVWLLLVGVMILLVGACIWGWQGHLDTTYQTGAIVKDGRAVCLIQRDEIEAMEEKMTARIGGTETKLVLVDDQPRKADTIQEEYALYLCGVTGEDWVFLAETQTDLPDGVYEAQIVVNSVRPITFILN